MHVVYVHYLVITCTSPHKEIELYVPFYRENIVVRRVEVVAMPSDVQSILTSYVHGQVCC